MIRRRFNMVLERRIGIRASLRIILIVFLAAMGITVFRISGGDIPECMDLIRTDRLFLSISGGAGHMQIEGACAGATPLPRDWSLPIPLLGTIGYRSLASAGWSRFFVFVPRGIVAGLLLAYPVTTAVRRPLRRWHRRKRGLCMSCGYDLTGNTTGVCPECAARIDSRHPRGDAVAREEETSSTSDDRAG